MKIYVNLIKELIDMKVDIKFQFNLNNNGLVLFRDCLNEYLGRREYRIEEFSLVENDYD